MEPRSGVYFVTAEAPIGTREKTAVKGDASVSSSRRPLYVSWKAPLSDHKVARASNNIVRRAGNFES